jgi:Tol biopolymer transport system component
MRLSADLVARGRGTISPDGKWVYYSEAAGESRKVSIDAGTAAAVFSAAPPQLPAGFHEPMPSPDGVTVAGHYSDPTAREHIALIPLAGGPAKLMPTVPASATWAPDGKALVYIETRTGISNLMRQPLAGGAATAMTKFSSEQIFSYAVSFDQRHVGLVRGHTNSDVVLISTARK